MKVSRLLGWFIITQVNGEHHGIFTTTKKHVRRIQLQSKLQQIK